MPQLDKISFSTQYLWLTFFVVILYWLTVEFFAMNVFKNLKLRKIISSVWQFFTYRFDFDNYQNSNRSFIKNSIDSIYSTYTKSFITFYKVIGALSKTL